MNIKRITVAAVAIVAMILTMGSACERAVDDIMRILGSTPGTFYNYGADGQVVFVAHCRSMHFVRATEYNVHRESEGKVIETTSVVQVSCGDNIITTVGFTSVYMSDG